jgi:hypothetical protein
MHNANLDAAFADGSGLYRMRAMAGAARIIRKLVNEVLWN